MTEEYKVKLASRISNMSGTGRIYIKRFFITFALCAASIFLGLLLYLLMPISADTSNDYFMSHFCYMFDGSSFSAAIKTVIRFARGDFALLIFIMLSGYTMVSGIISRMILFGHSVCLGYLLAAAHVFLISNGNISHAEGAFVLFFVCKLSVLLIHIFSTLESEDFSFRFARVFEKTSRPCFLPLSVNHLKIMLSAAGFSVIINALYLIFQHIQNYTPI